MWSSRRLNRTYSACDTSFFDYALVRRESPQDWWNVTDATERPTASSDFTSVCSYLKQYSTPSCTINYSRTARWQHLRRFIHSWFYVLCRSSGCTWKPKRWRWIIHEWRRVWWRCVSCWWHRREDVCCWRSIVPVDLSNGSQFTWELTCWRFGSSFSSNVRRSCYLREGWWCWGPWKTGCCVRKMWTQKCKTVI